MKTLLINNSKITKDEQLTQYLKEELLSYCEPRAFILEGVEIFSDLKGDLDHPLFRGLENYIFWVLDYFNLILEDNILLKNKTGKYNLFLSLTLDSENRKARLYFYVESDVFGLVVGSEYTNIVNLIRVSLPFFSKSKLNIELKMFPLNQDKTSEIKVYEN